MFLHKNPSSEKEGFLFLFLFDKSSTGKLVRLLVNFYDGRRNHTRLFKAR
jgi:hypothetical protein